MIANAKGERGSHPFRAHAAHITAHQFAQPAGDGKAKTDTLMLTRERAVALREWLEQLGALVLADPASSVGHLDAEEVVSSFLF
jgi:hypothetical protein